MQMQYRATRRLQPQSGDTLVRTGEQAHQIINKLERKIKFEQLSRAQKYNFLCVIATLYEALGDPKMLETAERAYKYEKGWGSTALLAVALHHFGKVKESLQFYKEAYRFDHEKGLEIDIGYSGALLFEGNWLQAWPIVKSLKKRMVYALYLPFWDGKPTKKISIVSEGGFGDLIHNSRYLPMVAEKCEDVTVYLPPYFFEHGFSDMLTDQPWFPKIKPMLDLPQTVPAAGFFDLPAIFQTTPTTIPDYPAVWEADPNIVLSIPEGKNLRVGFCWEARAMETPLCPKGVYRALTNEQAQKIVTEAPFVSWHSLQYKPTWIPNGVTQGELHNWKTTAKLIENLDLVVTVDTGVAHLAAAMGKPTWVILSGAVDWKFGLTDTTCPWYPTMRLFRNEAFGFEHSINAVIEALETNG